MAKKSMAVIAKSESTAASEAVDSADASQAMERPDPTLLGVRVPLSITFEAFKLVTDAWRECLRELSVAVKTKGVTVIKATEETVAPVVNA